MGRRKIEIKKIECPRARMVAFSKRRQGLFKKARDFSQLSGLRVAVLVFSQAGKPFFSGDASLFDILGLGFDYFNGLPANSSDGCESEEMGVVHDMGVGGSDGKGWNNIATDDECDVNAEAFCVDELITNMVGGGCASENEFDGGRDLIGMVDWENGKADSSTWRDEEHDLGSDLNLDCFDQMGVVRDMGVGGSDGKGWNNIATDDECDCNAEGFCVDELITNMVGGGCVSETEFDGGSDLIGMVDWENWKADSSTWRDEEHDLGSNLNLDCFDQIGVMHDMGVGGSDGKGWNNTATDDECDGNAEGFCVDELFTNMVGGGCASETEFDGGSDLIGMVDWENGKADSSTWRDEDHDLGSDLNPDCFDDEIDVGLHDLDSN